MSKKMTPRRQKEIATELEYLSAYFNRLSAEITPLQVPLLLPPEQELVQHIYERILLLEYRLLGTRQFSH